MESKESLNSNKHDLFINSLDKVVIACVKALAGVMVIVILWAFVDVLFHIANQLINSFDIIFSSNALFSIVGSVLIFLIAIEVYLNIVFFLKKDSINVPLVLATALTAIARKVIILDYTTTSDLHIVSTAALVLAVGIVYWLITKGNS